MDMAMILLLDFNEAVNNSVDEKTVYHNWDFVLFFR